MYFGTQYPAIKEHTHVHTGKHVFKALFKATCPSKASNSFPKPETRPAVSGWMFDLCHIPPLEGIQHIIQIKLSIKTMGNNNNKALILKPQTMFLTVKSNVPSVVK